LSVFAPLLELQPRIAAWHVEICAAAFVALNERVHRHPRYQQEAREMKYVMLILNTEATAKLTEAEQQAWSSEIMAWYEKHGSTGSIADMGHQLQPAQTARTVRATGVTDGPFMETKEVLGGFTVLESATYDEAVDLSKSWPGVDRGLITIELRPVVEF
jgi:hypothetical protein